MPPDEAAAPATPTIAAPVLRIGLYAAAGRPEFTGPAGLTVRDPDEGVLWSVAPGETVQAVADGDLIVLRSGNRSIRRRTILLAPDDSLGSVLVDGKAYRGDIELRRGSDGVQVINTVDLEAYLIAVVGAEMGRRTPEEMAALEAQAVAARTYAIRNLERHAGEGFDLTADIGSQVYRGVASELPLAQLAVEATRGEILTYDGLPIDAFYSSTCGGHTEATEAVFSGGSRPYLTAHPDQAPDGTAWCAISPAYRWRQSWNGSEIAATLRRTLAAERLPTARAGDLREARVLARTGSGRIAQLELVGSAGRTVVSGAAIRRVLAPPSGGLLRSNDFTLRISRSGGRLDRVEAEGRGYGHGVGMCQWGAIGRARAGQGYGEILISYFPGTELRRIY